MSNAPVIEHEWQAEMIRKRLESEPNEYAQRALDVWNNSRAKAPVPTKEERAGEAVGEELGLERGSAAGWVQLLDSMSINSDKRLELLREASEAEMPVTMRTPDGGVRETTPEERLEFQQEAMWESLNPLQKSLVAIGQGNEAAWDMVGLGSVEDAEEVVFEAFEKGDFYEALEVLGQAGAALSVAGTGLTGVGAVAKLLTTGIAKASRQGMQGAVDLLTSFFKSSPNKSAFADRVNATDLVASSKAGKATMKAIAKTDDDKVAEELTKSFISKVQVVEKPLMQSRDIRALNPVKARGAAMKRQQQQREAMKKLDKEAEEATELIRQRADSAVKKANDATRDKQVGDTLGTNASRYSRRYQEKKNKEALRGRNRGTRKYMGYN